MEIKNLKFKFIIINILVIMITLIIGMKFLEVYGAGTVRVSQDIYYSNTENLFCLNHGQDLPAEETQFDIVATVNIEGNKIVSSAKESEINAKMAYVLSASNGADKVAGPVANMIWTYMSSWASQGGAAELPAGFTIGTSAGSGVGYNELDLASTEYAKNFSNEKVKNNTNMENVKTVEVVKDGNVYMKIGPFNWTFTGTVTNINAVDQDGNAIEGVSCTGYEGAEETWYGVDKIQSQKDFYIAVPANVNIKSISLNANVSVSIKGVKLEFIKGPSGKNYQKLLNRYPYVITENVPLDLGKHDTLGNLKIIKVNEDNQEFKLAGVGFLIQNKGFGMYVNKSADGIISYVSSKEEATEFITDEQGEINLEGLIVGTYVAYETQNPNYGYEFIEEGIEIPIVVKETTEHIITNKQIWVKLSGFVWVNDGGPSDALLDEGGGNGPLLEGIKVKLKTKKPDASSTAEGSDPTIVMETTTGEGGKYLFMDVLIEELENYYIEFEYDGLTYQSVIPNIGEEKGSKSAESEENRIIFNNNFSSIEGSGFSSGYTLDAEGNKKHDLEYNVDTASRTSTLINNGQYPIIADTEETGYNIRENFEYGMEEVEYINLGLYEREQPDLSLAKDVQNVKVLVNGYEHTYNYGYKLAGGNPGMTYTRPIYKADYEYINDSDKSKELKVFVTYKIVLTNKSQTLIARVNSVAEYIDSEYHLKAIGTALDESGNATNDLIGNISVISQSANYLGLEIRNKTEIKPQSSSSIYVQVGLTRESVIKVLRDNPKMLNNVAEIKSYSIFDSEGKVYAGIDINSNPSNCNPEDFSTYQDDTDRAPGLKLVDTKDGGRKLRGTVFLDNTTLEANIREGNGKLDSDEIGIKDVEVILSENIDGGKVYNTTTDESGNFEIEGYIPGDYTLKYIWGDETYTVQKYKSTKFVDKSRYDSNMGNKEWYKNNVEERLSDAIDNYTTRLAIDEELKHITVTTPSSTTFTKMDSLAPTIGLGVEYDNSSTESYQYEDDYTYYVENLDLGISERPKQELQLTKRIKSLKVTLANGQVVVDLKVDENGQITGESKHTTFMKPSENTIPKNGFMKVELDNELLQGSVLEVEYDIKATNASELEYLSANFYHFGIIEGEVVTITPTAIVDYLDKNWGFETGRNPDWQIKTVDDIKALLDENVYINPESTIKDKIILYTEKLKTAKLKPGESDSVEIYVSKALTTTEEVSLGNETEILEWTKTGGSEPISIPGNYVPGLIDTLEPDTGSAETMIVTPSTGENREYITIIGLGISLLVILGAGVIIIKRKVLDK